MSVPPDRLIDQIQGSQGGRQPRAPPPQAPPQDPPPPMGEPDTDTEDEDWQDAGEGGEAQVEEEEEEEGEVTLRETTSLPPSLLWPPLGNSRNRHRGKEEG